MSYSPAYIAAVKSYLRDMEKGAEAAKQMNESNEVTDGIDHVRESQKFYRLIGPEEERSFWAMAACHAPSCIGAMSAIAATSYADTMLVEWRKRWVRHEPFFER